MCNHFPLQSEKKQMTAFKNIANKPYYYMYMKNMHVFYATS
jgi:hypothetical protein